MNDRYELVTLKNGARSVRSLQDGETFHPVAGPTAEAEALYIRQLRLRERISPGEEFVIWDVGLGAGGNALTAIRQLAGISSSLRVISFDRTLEALDFGARHASELQFPLGFEPQIQSLLDHCATTFQHSALQVNWTVHVADFPALIASTTQLPAPDAIFFDAFSPARNPGMWTLPLFENLFRRLDPQRPCALATFSRSTTARVAMLLAGFCVGIGDSIAGKEETTVAGNTLALFDRPLERRWLERIQTSRSAEPLKGDVYQRAPLSSQSLAQLSRHPQFQ